LINQDDLLDDLRAEMLKQFNAEIQGGSIVG